MTVQRTCQKRKSGSPLPATAIGRRFSRKYIDRPGRFCEGHFMPYIRNCKSTWRRFAEFQLTGRTEPANCQNQKPKMPWQGSFSSNERRAQTTHSPSTTTSLVPGWCQWSRPEQGGSGYFSREYDRAIEQLRAVLDMEPNFPRAQILVLRMHRKGCIRKDLRT